MVFQECEEVDLLGATLRLNPAKHKFTVVTPAGDDGKAPLHGFRTEGEVSRHPLFLHSLFLDCVSLPQTVWHRN